MWTEWMQPAVTGGASWLRSIGGWNIIDILLTLSVLTFGIIGAIRGFRAKMLSMFGWFVAFVVSARTYEYFIPWVRKHVFGVRLSGYDDEGIVGITTLQFSQKYGEQMLHAGVSFCLMFGFVWIGLWLLKLLLTRMAHARSVRWLDRLGGAAIGILQFFLLWGILYVLLKSLPNPMIRGALDQSQWAMKTGEWLPVVLAESIRWAQWL